MGYGVSCCGHIFLRLYSNMRLLSVSWSCISGPHYTRGITLKRQYFEGVWENLVSQDSFVLGLFLTSLLKPFEQNLTVTILIKLKRVLLHGHIAKVEMMWI